MKIGILTQPLHNNYGGLLQNYALQTVLKDMGHDTYTINIVKNNNKLHLKLLSFGKRILLNLLGKKVAYRVFPTKREHDIISKNTRAFIINNIKTTSQYTQKITSQLMRKYALDAYVVGSDQVWRPRYSPQMSTYFLDFIANDPFPKKIAYAASFGVKNLEFSYGEFHKFAKLLKLFTAVSVREDSAVQLCKKHFDVEAVHLLDPTMLLNKDYYSKLINKGFTKEIAGNLYTYVLDKNTEKSEFIDKVAKMCDLTPFTVMPKELFSDPGKKNINNCIYPAVEQWLRGFMDAEFVITDSFHGTVFSILFNKPFIAIANSNRGIARFESLLKLFELENKLITNLQESNLDYLMKSKIDWKRVNDILEREQEKARDFLMINLK